MTELTKKQKENKLKELNKSTVSDSKINSKQDSILQSSIIKSIQGVKQ
jgi:hypothetical protein